jgi:hypothetical protein
VRENITDLSLYIACQLAKELSTSFEPQDYLSSQFLAAASPVLNEVDSHVVKVINDRKVLPSIIREFVSYANSKL